MYHAWNLVGRLAVSSCLIHRVLHVEALNRLALDVQPVSNSRHYYIRTRLSSLGINTGMLLAALGAI